MAFLPPKITYNLNEIKQEAEAGESSSKPKFEFVFMPEYIESGIGMDEKFMKEYFDSFYTKTKRGNKIACLYIRNPKKDVKYTILFSHGNAADLGMLTVRLPLVIAVDVKLKLIFVILGFLLSSRPPSQRELVQL